MLSTGNLGNRVVVALRLQHWAIIQRPFSLAARFTLKV